MKEYKRTCGFKKYNFWQNNFNILENSCKDSKKFWDKWKQCTNNYNKNLNTKITGDEWYNHFSKLHSSGTNDVIDVIYGASDLPCAALSRTFTLTALSEGIDK